jgi:hypothetical protein
MIFLSFCITKVLFSAFSGIMLIVLPFLKMMSRACKSGTIPTTNQKSAEAKAANQNEW